MKRPGFLLLPVESEIPGVYLSCKSDLVILWLALGLPDNCTKLPLTENRWVTSTREIIQ